MSVGLECGCVKCVTSELEICVPVGVGASHVSSVKNIMPVLASPGPSLLTLCREHILHQVWSPSSIVGTR